MDGAGRLARSVRSLGPQADLKAAAIGAAVLLRERLGLRARVPAKPVIDREPPNRLVLLVERYLPNRARRRLDRADAARQRRPWASSRAVMSTNSWLRSATPAMRWPIRPGSASPTVAINGRKQLSQDEVLAIGGVNGRSSLLFLDAATVRDKLKANPWISDATILKLYPGQLQIDIVERTAFALWQQDGRLSVISEDGAVLEPYVSRRFVTLPLVVGKGADVKARDFLALLDRYPQVRISDQGCDPRRRTALEFAAEGRPRHSPAGERRRQCACHAEQARQGGPAVLARHRRRRHAPAGPA